VDVDIEGTLFDHIEVIARVTLLDDLKRVSEKTTTIVWDFHDILGERVAYLDTLDGNWLFYERTQNLCTLLIVEVAEKKVGAESALKALQLFLRLWEYWTSPVVVAVGVWFQRLCRDRCPSGKVIVSREGIGI